MSFPPNVREIPFSVCVDDLLGPLGYAERGAVESAIMEQILSETERCERMMMGKAVYSIMEIRRLSGSAAVEIDGLSIEDRTLLASLDGARSLAVAVCTVGAEIDRIVDEHFRRSDFLRGMIADVLGSRAVEDVAEQCTALICAEARELNLYSSGRLSPGYGTWDVSGQRAVFTVIDPSPIDVSLNEHCMMQPKKSISFVVPLTEEESSGQLRHPCLGCGLQHCDYRRK
jgi:hypothetical protein